MMHEEKSHPWGNTLIIIIKNVVLNAYIVDKGGSRLGNFKPLFQNQNVIYEKSEGIRAKYIYYVYRYA